MIAQVESFYPGWYFNPSRWPTTDGYAPFKVVVAQWHAMQMVKAMQQLELAVVVRMAFHAGVDDWQPFAEQLASTALLGGERDD